MSSGQLAATGQDTTTTSGPLTQWFDLASSAGQTLQAVPTDPDLESELTEGTDPVLAAHRVLAELALLALDRSDPQACVRPAGQACRRGLGLGLPANASKALPVAPGRCWPHSPIRPPPPDGRPPPTPAPPRSRRRRWSSRSASPGSSTPSIPPPRAAPPAPPTPTSCVIWPPSRCPASARTRTRFRLVSGHTDAFASMVAGTDSTTGLALVTSWSKLVLASGAVGLSEAEQLHYLDRVETEVVGQASQITAPTQQTVTLTSASGRIPFSISNPLPYPVRVRLVFQSPKLHFVDGNPQFVTLPANQPRHLQIAVTARASGAFPMQVTITSPDGRLTISHTQFDVRSTAVSGIGLALTVAAGAFLLLWWARHYRDARRRRGLVESSHPVLRSDPAADHDHYAAPTD